MANNKGHVVIGIDHDTGQFAVASIRGWWRAEGRRLYPNAKRLLITAAIRPGPQVGAASSAFQLMPYSSHQ